MLPLGFAVAAAAGLTIILNFDGSLRPPRDPMPGFRHSKSPTLASCSATVSLQHSNREDISFAIGGKLLPIMPGISTAADAEYEGLLLGLKWLSNELNRTDDVLSDAATLIIRGDCKAIIDQLKSKSTPRRMETHYNIATRYIRDIRKLFFDKSFRELSVVYELIPRDDNYLCVAICKLVTNKIQLEAVRQIEELISCHHLENALEELLRNRSVCHSSRIALGCCLAEECLYQMEINDAYYDDVSWIFHQLSGFFMESSRQWSKICWKLEDDDVGKERLKQMSIACLKLSLRCMKIPNRISGDENDHDCDVQLVRNNVEIMFGKCTNSKQCSSCALLNPYVEDMHAVVRSCYPDNESLQSLLRRWDEHVSTKVASGQDLWMLESPMQEVIGKDNLSSKTGVYPYSSKWKQL